MVSRPALAGVLCALVLVSACARPVGDFGRAEPSVVHDRLMPAQGRLLARAAGEPVSELNRTDEEREMDDRLWRFLTAPHPGDRSQNASAELQRTRISGERDHAFSPDRYYAHLRATPYASSSVRYRTLANDVSLDLALLPDAFRAVCAVLTVDRRRALALAGVSAPPPDGEAQVSARAWENESTILWFVRALDDRYRSYALALERLLVETPHEEARAVHDPLRRLAAWRDRAASHAFCAPASAAPRALK